MFVVDRVTPTVNVLDVITTASQIANVKKRKKLN